MKKVNLMAEECTLLHESEVRGILSEYFGSENYEVNELVFHPDKVYIDLQYQDFVPESEAWNYLKGKIPALQGTLTRDYSKAVIDQVVHDMRTEYLDVWCYDLNRQLCRVNLYTLLRAWLSDKVVKEGVVV